VIRIVAPEGNYDYQNKYFTDDTKYLVPCGLPRAKRPPSRRWCSRPTACWAAAAGARVDVMIDAATRKPSCWRSTPRPA
jgi:D-alanine-D-alanine ligase